MDKGANEFIVPAMIVPAMLDMAYESVFDIQNTNVRMLKVHGVENIDWKQLRKSQILNVVIDDYIEKIENSVTCGPYAVPDGAGVYWSIPGRPSAAPIQVLRSAGNAAKWCFITPRFARVLILRSPQPLARGLAEFYLAIHDEVVKFSRGESSLIDTIGQKRKIEEDPEERRLRLRREEVEIAKLEIENKKHELENKKHELEFMQESFQWQNNNFALDERDIIFFKDLFRRNSRISNSSSSLLLTNTSSTSSTPTQCISDCTGGELSIHIVAQEMQLNQRDYNSSSVGKILKSLYSQKYNSDPPKRRVLFQGRPILENCYYEKDRSLIENALKTYINKEKGANTHKPTGLNRRI